MERSAVTVPVEPEAYTDGTRGDTRIDGTLLWCGPNGGDARLHVLVRMLLHNNPANWCAPR